MPIHGEGGNHSIVVAGDVAVVGVVVAVVAICIVLFKHL